MKNTTTGWMINRGHFSEVMNNILPHCEKQSARCVPKSEGQWDIVNFPALGNLHNYFFLTCQKQIAQFLRFSLEIIVIIYS